jgi:hypothetical protein
MRGSPLLRALIAFVAIGLTVWPLLRLTRRASAVSAPSPAAHESKLVSAHLELAFTQLPQRISVMHLGKEIWVSEVKDAEIEHEISLPWPDEGIDLRFLIAWPEGAPLAAAQVHIAAPDGRELEQSIWSRGPADTVLTFR